jgi:ubiquinone/menaquinone biosynthesis C-methylase UbiE
MRIFETLRAFQETAALKSAIELGIFSAIAEGATTAGQIATKCGASERGVRILCDTLTASELLLKREGQYQNTRDGAMFLDRHSPAYLGGVADFLCLPELMSGFLENLTEAVRKGATVQPDAGIVNQDNPMWVTFARAMAPLTKLSAEFIAGHVSATGPLKVLDIAAGHGMYGIAIAQRNPRAEITAVDWAAVLEVAKQNAAKAGVSSRYTTKPGSAFDVDFGSGYDVVLLTNFLHHFDTETNQPLLRKVHAALNAGGKAVTLEFVPGEDRVSPPVAVRFALTMLVNTRQGDAYTFRELETMLRNAGFTASEQHFLETQQSVIISTK